MKYPLALVLLTDDAKKTLPIGMANLFEVQEACDRLGCTGLRTCDHYDPPTMTIYLIGQRYLLQESVQAVWKG